MIRIVRFNDGKGVTSAGLKVDWDKEIRPIIEEYYSVQRADALTKKITENTVLYPILPDGVYQIVDEANSNIVYRITKKGWKKVGNYAELLIKEEDLTFLYDILIKECADLIKEKILQVQEKQLKSLEYEKSMNFNDSGEVFIDYFNPVYVAEQVLSKYYSQKIVDEKKLEIISLLYGSQEFKSMIFCTFGKSDFKFVNSEGVIEYIGYEEKLLPYIKNLDPSVDANEICSELEEELITKQRMLASEFGSLYRAIYDGDYKFIFRMVRDLFS